MKYEYMNKTEILFPSFATLYIDDNDKTCIYYFRGLTTENKYIYQEFNEEELPEYNKNLTDDGSIIYEFKSNISSVSCHLLSNFDDIKDKNIVAKFNKSKKIS